MRPVNTDIYTCAPLHPTAHGMIQCARNTIFLLSLLWTDFPVVSQDQGCCEQPQTCPHWKTPRAINLGSRLTVELLGLRAYEYNSDTINSIKFTSSLRLAPERLTSPHSSQRWECLHSCRYSALLSILSYLISI